MINQCCHFSLIAHGSQGTSPRQEVRERSRSACRSAMRLSALDEILPRGAAISKLRAVRRAGEDGSNVYRAAWLSPAHGWRSSHVREGLRENNVRPSIDPMLRSAAVRCGERTIGVVLTGNQSDGASGLGALNRCGGITVVQDPRVAAFS